MSDRHEANGISAALAIPFRVACVCLVIGSTSTAFNQTCLKKAREAFNELPPEKQSALISHALHLSETNGPTQEEFKATARWIKHIPHDQLKIELEKTANQLLRLPSTLQPVEDTIKYTNAVITGREAEPVGGMRR